MRTARYYQVRHAVRMLFWSAVVAAGFTALLIVAGLIASLFGADLSDTP